MSTIQVLAVASELFPLIKTGGLADVTGALPLALAAEGVRTVTLVPGYPSVLAALPTAEVIHRIPDLFGGPARLLHGTASGLELVAVEAPHLYQRPGNPYVGPDGRDWYDNAVRFAGLARAAVALTTRAVATGPGTNGPRTNGPLADFVPDIVHAHDWQAGLVPALLHYGGGPRPGTVMTVHNLAFQGLFPADLLGLLGLPPTAWAIDGVEFHGSISYLKAGLALADRITTVSPTYATEIRTPDGGMGLDGLLRARSGVLHGILNGIDDQVWNPAADTLIAAPFDIRRIARRAVNKQTVQDRFGLTRAPGTLLLGVISRLTWQMGLDLLLDELAPILDLGVQLAVLGTGDAAMEARFTAAAATHPGQVGCVIGYDEGLAHQMQAGIDALLVPSRFEPCGLTQLCALRYGALPVVARVGGLADTVIDANEAALAAGIATGIQFSSGMLLPAIERAVALWRDPDMWTRMRRNAMRADVSWRRPAAHYASLYRDLIAQRGAERGAGQGVGPDAKQGIGRDI